MKKLSSITKEHIQLIAIILVVIGIIIAIPLLMFTSWS